MASSKVDSVQMRSQYLISLKITQENIYKIALFLKNELLQYGSDSPKELSFILSSDSLSAWHSSNPDIFSKDGPLTMERIVTIEMSMSVIKPARKINIKMSHGHSSTENRFYVAADDEKWMDGTFEALKKIFNSFEKQMELSKKQRILLRLFLAIIVGIALYSMINFIFNYIYVVEPIPNVPDWVKHNLGPILIAFYMISDFAFGWLISGVILRYIDSIYPSIELITGPNYKKVEEIRRNKLKWLIGYIAIPLILSYSLQLIAALWPK